MSEIKLLPCPFCGGDVTLHPPHADIGAWVSCKKCGLEGPTETGITEADAASHWNRRASLSSAAVAEREPVAQFRKAGCSDWYDGLPDHQDGRGPYEKRTLYLGPPPTSELEAENARLQARVAELDKAVFDIQIMSVASAACFTNAQLENILTMIERTARRVREGGKS